MKVTKNIFRLASLSPRITRVYYYHWRSPGTPQSAKKSTWDAGLVTANGVARPALFAVAKALHRSIQTATPSSFEGQSRVDLEHIWLELGHALRAIAKNAIPTPARALDRDRQVRSPNGNV